MACFARTTEEATKPPPPKELYCGDAGLAIPNEAERKFRSFTASHLEEGTQDLGLFSLTTPSVDSGCFVSGRILEFLTLTFSFFLTLSQVS
jgi:hypothetical protein